MSIQSEITRIDDNVNEAFDAIVAIGGSVVTSRNSDNLRQSIYTAAKTVPITSENYIYVPTTTTEYLGDVTEFTFDLSDYSMFPTLHLQWWWGVFDASVEGNVTDVGVDEKVDAYVGADAYNGDSLIRSTSTTDTTARTKANARSKTLMCYNSSSNIADKIVFRVVIQHESGSSSHTHVTGQNCALYCKAWVTFSSTT